MWNTVKDFIFVSLNFQNYVSFWHIFLAFFYTEEELSFMFYTGTTGGSG